MSADELKLFLRLFLVYHTIYPGRPIEAPITRLLWKFGYDGIYASNESDDTVTRGNVMFVRPDVDITRKVRIGAEQFVPKPWH
jgi:hypothetical protein